MSEEQLKELQEYNLEYLEAVQSEEIFGGDYTSAVELKYAKREIERLNKRIKELEEGFKASTEDLCEESTKIEKAIEFCNKWLDCETDEKYEDEILAICKIRNILKGSE